MNPSIEPLPSRRDLPVLELPSDGGGLGNGLVSLALLSLVAGTAAGLLGATFRFSLQQADRWREAIVQGSHSYGWSGLAIVVIAGAAVTAFAAWLVQRFSPEAAGSGIPHVEAVLFGEKSPSRLSLLFVKFFGGLLAIGAGLALGREGPTVQMGASISHMIGSVFRRSAADARILLAAGAGAGLATAFNAPIAGAVFVLEELVRQFNTRITIATLGASAAAITVAQTFLGQAPDFTVRPLMPPSLAMVLISFVLGIVVGGLGLAYNVSILGARNGVARWKFMPPGLRAASIGGVVALIAWFAPQWVGGGDAITQRVLDGDVAISVLPAAFAVRFALGAVSYAAGTPGGLFAPMLVLGAQAGQWVGAVGNRWFPTAGLDPTACAVVGMAAFFTAVVRAPVTGIILVIELTASDTQLLPMLAACCGAMLVPTLANNRPIYDALSERNAPPSG